MRGGMACYVLIHGAGSTAWYWHLVAPELRARGHEVLTPDLPVDDDNAGLSAYVETVVDAIGERSDVVLVAQSLAGFVAPIVATRTRVALIVLVAAMVPKPNETLGAWWSDTGHAALGINMDDPVELFLHDVPPDIAAESAQHVRDQSGRPFDDMWPLDRWPDVPTRALIGRDDRLFPADFQRRVVRERLGFDPDEIDGGHLPALARPVALVDRLETYRMQIAPR